MDKPLSEMSLEELWQLFPIRLTAHQDCWADWYRAERDRLLAVLGPEGICRISHIGSTAVSGIWAKPIIDILLEVRDHRAMERIGAALPGAGYLLMSQTGDRMSWNRGYTQQGFARQVFHLHLRLEGDHEELYFRDYLIRHPTVARQYEALKLELWKRFEHDRDAYTQAKTAFVRRWTEQAKADDPGRWEPENR